MGKTKRAGRGIALLAGIVVLLAVVVLVGLRVNYVNASVPEHRLYRFGLGDAAPYESYPNNPSENDASSQGGIVLTVLGSTILNQEEATRLAPDYDDGTIASGGASDVKILLVRIRFSNTSSEEETASLSHLSAQEGAWHNGADPRLFQALNPERGCGSPLGPPRRRSRAVFCGP